MHPLYIISGISASGKSTLGQFLVKSNFIDGIKYIDEDEFYLKDKPSVTLSNGEIVSNWDCLEAINPRFTEVVGDALKSSPVLLTGFALPATLLPVAAAVHIHLVTADNPVDLEMRCRLARTISKPLNNSERDALMIREVVIPFYHRMVRESDISHIMPVFDKDSRFPIDMLASVAKSIIRMAEITRERHHFMEVQEPYYSLIAKGIKPVEGRKISSKSLKIRRGDHITMVCGDNPSFNMEVTGVTMYLPNIGDPLTEYLITETLARTLPGISTVEEGRKIYLQWSTEEEIMKMGMMGIQVQCL
jgi:ASC-1-like (ASCH) protein